MQGVSHKTCYRSFVAAFLASEPHKCSTSLPMLCANTSNPPPPPPKYCTWVFFLLFFSFLFKTWNLLGYFIWHIMLLSILYHLKNPRHLLKFHVGRFTHFCIFKFKDSDQFCVSDRAEKRIRTVNLSLPFCFLRHKHGSIFCYAYIQS